MRPMYKDVAIINMYVRSPMTCSIDHQAIKH
jgi:hypothetical protein